MSEQHGELPPFPNLYMVKHVAENACKACVLCYKPTNTVLITPDKHDWFYVCNVHLKDKNYAKLIYCDDAGKDTQPEWKELCDKVDKVQREIHKIEKLEKEKQNKEKSWLSSIPSWNSKKEDDLKEKKEDKDMDTKESKSKDILLSELKENQDRLTIFERSNIKYRLEKVFYTGRLMQDYKRRKQAEIEQKLAAGTLFPSLDGLSKLKN